MYTEVNFTELLEKDLEKNPDLREYADELDAQYEIIRVLKNQRKQMKLTQEDIAERTGMTRQMVSRIEKLNNSPSLENFMKYVNAIGGKIKIDF